MYGHAYHLTEPEIAPSPVHNTNAENYEVPGRKKKYRNEITLSYGKNGITTPS
jgi:hypothetical protein